MSENECFTISFNVIKEEDQNKFDLYLNKNFMEYSKSKFDKIYFYEVSANQKQLNDIESMLSKIEV